MNAHFLSCRYGKGKWAVIKAEYNFRPTRTTENVRQAYRLWLKHNPGLASSNAEEETKVTRACSNNTLPNKRGGEGGGEGGSQPRPLLSDEQHDSQSHAKKSCPVSPSPSTLNPVLPTINHQPSNLNPPPSILNPSPYTPKPLTPNPWNKVPSSRLGIQVQGAQPPATPTPHLAEMTLPAAPRSSEGPTRQVAPRPSPSLPCIDSLSSVCECTCTWSLYLSLSLSLSHSFSLLSLALSKNDDYRQNRF
jgi:hypothetical protein